MPVTKSPGTNATILLLSSEPVVRAVMKEALEHAGYIVLATGDLGGAVDMLTSADIDLLITHPYVDNIPGHEAAKYLRSRTSRKITVLIVAGLLDDDRLQYRAELQEFNIFPPPFSTSQLIEEVRKILNES
jgi:CheY-like chemotaxis protein